MPLRACARACFRFLFTGVADNVSRLPFLLLWLFFLSAPSFDAVYSVTKAKGGGKKRTLLKNAARLCVCVRFGTCKTACIFFFFASGCICVLVCKECAQFSLLRNCLRSKPRSNIIFFLFFFIHRYVCDINCSAFSFISRLAVSLYPFFSERLSFFFFVFLDDRQRPVSAEVWLLRQGGIFK